MPEPLVVRILFPKPLLTLYTLHCGVTGLMIDTNDRTPFFRSEKTARLKATLLRNSSRGFYLTLLQDREAELLRLLAARNIPLPKPSDYGWVHITRELGLRSWPFLIQSWRMNPSALEITEAPFPRKKKRPPPYDLDSHGAANTSVLAAGTHLRVELARNPSGRPVEIKR